MLCEKKRKCLEISMSENSLLIMVGKSEVSRNGDVFYPFRQDSDFLLLTALNTPDVKLIAIKENKKIEWILYSDPISDKEKLWGTNRLSYELLRKKSGIEEIRSLDRWRIDIKKLSEQAKKIYFRKCDEKKIIPGFSKWSEKFAPLEEELLSLRMYKMDEEIEYMKKAIGLTQMALNYVNERLSSYQYEREIEADIAMIYRRYGCIEAYPTIVASGSNACILHYTTYDRKIEDGDLILIDTGAEFEGYAADISRTCKKGKISERKHEIYETVKSIQIDAIAAIRPGRSWDEHERVMRDIMNHHLKRIGLIPKDAVTGEEEIYSRKYFPHRMSHFLGLDVHDSGAKSDILKAGMVITCEPGIYIRDEGIGIRIEDDILITETGSKVLSSDIAK